MDKNLPPIEDFFTSALKDDEQMPPNRVWEEIGSRLNEAPVSTLEKKYRHLKKVAALLFFLLTGVSLYKFERQPSSSLLKKEPGSDKITGLDVTGKKGETPLNHTFVYRKPATNASPKRNFTGIENAASETSRNTTIAGSNGLKHYINSNKPWINYNKEGRSYAAKKSTRIKDDPSPAIPSPSMVTVSLLAPKPAHLLADAIRVADGHFLFVLQEAVSGSRNVAAHGTKAKAAARFSVHLFLSPDFASYRLRNDVPGSRHDEAAEIEKNERHEFSSTLGALIMYKAARHWKIGSGLTFSNTNISVAPQTIYAQPDNSGNIKYLINMSSGYGYVLPSFSNNPAVGDSIYAAASVHTLKYLSIPATVQFITTKGRFSLHAIAGTAVNFLLQGKVETIIKDGIRNESEIVNKLQGLKKAYLNGLVGVGVDYTFAHKLAITFTPTCRYALGSINRDSFVKSYPYSLSLTTGLSFDF